MSNNDVPRDDKMLVKKVDDDIKRYGTLKTAFCKVAESELGNT